jgi:cell division septal protein FtsQ
MDDELLSIRQIEHLVDVSQRQAYDKRWKAYRRARRREIAVCFVLLVLLLGLVVFVGYLTATLTT